MDTYEGDDENPLSLHKYLYASGNPVNRIDPSGNDDMADVGMAMAVGITLDAMPSSAMVGAAAVKLAHFAALWQNYPSHGAFPTDPSLPNSIWSTIGGHVQMNEWTEDANGNRVPNNTCALRMSYTLNRSGYPIPKGSGAISGADGSWYLLRVKSLQTFLTSTLGAPTSLPGGTFTGPSGKTGIISFNVSGWSDATGHFTLWNGQSVVDSDEPYQKWPAPTSTLFWGIQ